MAQFLRFPFKPSSFAADNLAHTYHSSWLCQLGPNKHQIHTPYTNTWMHVVVVVVVFMLGVCYKQSKHQSFIVHTQQKLPLYIDSMFVHVISQSYENTPLTTNIDSPAYQYDQEQAKACHLLA